MGLSKLLFRLLTLRANPSTPFNYAPLSLMIIVKSIVVHKHRYKL